MSDDEATANNESQPAVGAPVQPSVRPPRKAAVDRLCRVLDEWRREERNLRTNYGPPDNLPAGCFRSKRIKDAEALQQTLAYLLARRSSGKAA